MNYEPQDITTLIEEVHRIGGEHVDEMCTARQYDLTGPVRMRPNDILMLPGCGHTFMFQVPYAAPDGSLRPITLCAVCDDMGSMPRFRSGE